MTFHVSFADFPVDAQDVAGAHPSRERYDPLARALHWIFAAGILYASGAGYAMRLLPAGPLRETLSHLNMSVATVLLALLPVRLVWRRLRREPAPPAGLSRANLRIAHGAHLLLYLLMTIVLVSGFVMVPHGYWLFGLDYVRTPFEAGAVTRACFAVHRVACAALAGLVVLHLLGVAMHTVVRPTGLLRRML